MKLYNSIGPNPRLVRIFAQEKGIDLDLVPVDLMGGENRAEPFKQDVNAAGQLPCLELDDGTHIAETTVICEYLEELNPEPVLIGATAEERALTRMWTRRVTLHVIEPLANGFRYSEGLPLFKDRIRTLPEAADGLKAVARDGMEWMDQRLAGQDFLAGRYGLADISLFAFLEFGSQIGQGFDGLENVGKWFERVASRTAVEASK